MATRAGTVPQREWDQAAASGNAVLLGRLRGAFEDQALGDEPVLVRGLTSVQVVRLTDEAGSDVLAEGASWVLLVAGSLENNVQRVGASVEEAQHQALGNCGKDLSEAQEAFLFRSVETSVRSLLRKMENSRNSA